MGRFHAFTDSEKTLLARGLTFNALEAAQYLDCADQQAAGTFHGVLAACTELLHELADEMPYGRSVQQSAAWFAAQAVDQTCAERAGHARLVGDERCRLCGLTGLQYIGIVNDKEPPEGAWAHPGRL